MTMLEILLERKEIYKGNLEKPCFSKEEKRDIESRINELNNLIFIITAKDIDTVK